MQLGIAAVLGAGFLVAAFSASEKKLMWAMLLLVPFQPISSRYGSITEFLVFGIAVIFLQKGRMTRFPLRGPIAFIMLAYMLSLTQAIPGSMREHLIYVLAAFSNFVIFWLVYNFVLREGGWQTILKILGVMNALILVYCGLQLTFGADQIAFLGVRELQLQGATEATEQYGARRITGPFGATAMIAEYFTIQIMIWAYVMIFATGKHQRTLVLALIALNCAFLVATGNRGGIVTLAIGSLGYLYLFRKDLGMRRVIKISISGALLFAAMAFVIVNYTEFGSVFSRLQDTEFEQGYIPDTRSGWVDLWDQVVEKPILGHGPRLGLSTEVLRGNPGYRYMPHPHNLYMWLFYTIGGVGLAAYAYFIVALWRRYSRAGRYSLDDKILSGMPKLGLLVLVIFLVSELRMELMRFALHPYQLYFFMLLGMFLAFSDLLRSRALRSQPVRKKRLTGFTPAAMRNIT